MLLRMIKFWLEPIGLFNADVPKGISQKANVTAQLEK